MGRAASEQAVGVSERVSFFLFLLATSSPPPARCLFNEFLSTYKQRAHTETRIALQERCTQSSAAPSDQSLKATGMPMFCPCCCHPYMLRTTDAEHFRVVSTLQNFYVLIFRILIIYCWAGNTIIEPGQ